MISFRDTERDAALHVTGISHLERFFRTVAELDVDKEDLSRFNPFINRKMYDLLLLGQATAKANGRPAVLPEDLPITKGLQERMHEFRLLGLDQELRDTFNQILAHPPLDLAYSDELEERLPQIAGGLSIALARCFKIIDPELKNPQTRHWEQAFQIFDLLL
jgi:hypothetical protein